MQKNQLLKVKKDFIELKDTELKDTEVKIKRDVEKVLCLQLIQVGFKKKGMKKIRPMKTLSMIV